MPLSPTSLLGDVVEVWLAQFQSEVKNGQRSASTLSNYRRASKRFGALLVRPVSELQCSEVLTWYEARTAVASSAMAFGDHEALRACLAYARRRDLLWGNPAAALGVVHTPKPPRPIRPEQIEVWRAGLVKLTERRSGWLARRRPNELEAIGVFSSLRALALLEQTGRRISEVCKIEVSQVWIADRAIILPRTKTGPSVIPLTEATGALVREQLRVLAGRATFLFPSPTGWDRHIAVKSTWDAFHDVCRLARITNVRPHDLRHGFAWAALKGGARLDDLSRALGHRNIRTTQRRYGHGVFTTPGMYAVGELVERIKTGGVH